MIYQNGHKPKIQSSQNNFIKDRNSNLYLSENHVLER